MSKNTVIFISYDEQDNLGVSYLSTMLSLRGYKVKIVDFKLNKEEIYKQIKNVDPIIIGFSLIFQYHFFRMYEIAKYLRKNGLDCHFTVGGHYPSLRFEDTLNHIPYIDSVVRFEGEFTICELVENLNEKKDWRKIRGIAYRNNGTPISNDLRPLIQDLDTLPIPLRTNNNRHVCMGINAAFLIASRGCVRNCSFCSIRRFYQLPKGKLRRNRSPTNVVKEMRELYKRKKTRIFLFQDDDFLLTGRIGQKWILDFISELESQGLAEKIFWKINCRSDEINTELFNILKNVGLFLVYLGIESGNQKGLEVLNKQLSVEDNINAVNILNQHNILYEFGFMLFDPSSTFESITDNINFLRKICGNGSSPVTFCKMIPYAETPIEKKLMSEGRLKGSILYPNYDFLDPRLDKLFSYLSRIFYKWIFTNEGILVKLRWHRMELAVLKKFYAETKNIAGYEVYLREIIASYNDLFFDVVEEATKIFENDGSSSQEQLEQITDYLQEEQRKIYSKWYNGMIEFQKYQKT